MSTVPLLLNVTVPPDPQSQAPTILPHGWFAALGFGLATAVFARPSSFEPDGGASTAPDTPLSCLPIVPPMLPVSAYAEWGNCMMATAITVRRNMRLFSPLQSRS